MLAAVLTACTSGSDRSGSVSVSPTLTPEQLRRQPEVTIPFSEQNWARGMHTYLYVAVIPKGTDVCRNYGFRSKMRMLVAYQTDCSSFAGTRRDDLFFYVALRNVSDERARFELQNFTLQTRDGSSIPAARAGGRPSSDFLPDSEPLAPRSNVFGYVSFDAAGSLPARLNYVDGDQTLTVVFDGEPARAK